MPFAPVHLVLCRESDVLDVKGLIHVIDAVEDAPPADTQPAVAGSPRNAARRFRVLGEHVACREHFIQCVGALLQEIAPWR